MQPDNNFFTLLENFEGFRSCPYKDQAGVWTIGIGSIAYLNGNPVKEGDPCISHDSAVTLATYELITYINVVNACVKSALTQSQFNALLSFTYNEGTKALKTSHLLIKVNLNPSDPTIKDEFLKWNKVRDPITHQLKYDAGLEARRAKEAKLYFS
jgi:lysozyme